MKSFLNFILVLTIITTMGFVSNSAWARSISIDGYLNDWGIDTSHFQVNDNDWSSPYADVSVAQEDWVGSGGYVSPGYGGQNYDIEALMVTYDATNLYIAIASGFPPTGNNHYGPGDIAIDLGADGSYEYAFVLDPYGRQSVSEEGIYQVTSADAWEDVLYNQHAASNPFRLKDTSSLFQQVGTGSLAYTSDNTPRYLIEVSIPWNALGNYQGSYSVHWTMGCGNDNLTVTALHTPEPATWVLMGMTLTVIGFVGRKLHSKP